MFWYTLFDNLQIIIYNYYIYMMDTFRLIYLVNSTHTVWPTLFHDHVCLMNNKWKVDVPHDGSNPDIHVRAVAPDLEAQIGGMDQ